MSYFKTVLIAFVFCLGAVTQGKQVFVKTDTQSEIEVGRAVYDSILSQGLVSKNDLYIRRVNRVFSQLTSVLTQKLYPFQVVVVASNQINAECLPGGYVTVFEGLLAKMPDDDQLAFVLAHEIGHGYRRHYVRRMRKMQSEVASQAIVSILFGTEIDNRAIGLASLRFTRENETEADEFGTELYLRAGFDPNQVTSGMKVIASLDDGGQHVPEYLLTHPEPAKRVAHIQEVADKLLAKGLKPQNADLTDISVESVFGKIPVISPIPCKWVTSTTGETWKYRVSSSQSADSEYSVKALGIASIGSTPIVRMEIDMAGKVIPYQMIVDGDRVYRRNRPTNQKSEWAVEVVFPDVGRTDGEGDLSCEAVKTEAVETPAGTFKDCLVLEVKQGTRTLKCWYAPSVGLVKRINEASGVTEILVSHYVP